MPKIEIQCDACTLWVEAGDYLEHMDPQEGLCRPRLRALFDAAFDPDQSRPIPSLGAPALPFLEMDDITAFNSEQLKVAAEVHAAFFSRGLLVRSVQVHRPKLFPTAALTARAPGASVVGMKRDCWSMIHPRVGQPLFQMSQDGTEENLAGRCFALMLDWEATWDRIVDASTVDQSSNQTFSNGERLPRSLEEVRETMGRFVAELAQAAGNNNNEVRTFGTHNKALVGFVWSPSAISTLNPAGGLRWSMSKPSFQQYVNTICAAGGDNPVTRKMFPVFAYRLPPGGGMKLRLVDVLTAR